MSGYMDKKLRANKKIVSKLQMYMRDFGAIFFVILFFPYIVYTCMYGSKQQLFQRTVKHDTYVTMNTGIGIQRIPLEEYLIGALAASIDVSYKEEALKAQAVLLRTEVEYNKTAGHCRQLDSGESEVSLADMGQAYISTYDLQKKYETAFMEVYEKLYSAVKETEGIYLVYEGIPVDTPFCAVTAGSTRCGEEVFESREYPYLRSVICESDILAKNYSKNYYFTWKELCSAFEIPETEKVDITITRRDKTGYALQMEVNGKTMTGEEFREKLQLNSSHIELEVLNQGIGIQTKGVGHGLGMSQNTAQYMAEKGSDFIEILSFFYADTEIEKE